VLYFRPNPLNRLLILALLLAASPVSWAQFETRGTSAVVSAPQAIAVGDFNHDGKLDLAVASTCCPDGGVSILLGNGDGTFQSPLNYNAGVAPVSIVAADFNHDGNLDLAVANSLSTNVNILLGNGDGTFRAGPQNPSLPAFENFVAVGDFNGDGKPDIVTVSWSNPCKCISVLLGNGDGTFQAAVNTEPPFTVESIGIGDFNGDGNLDLATAGDFSINILLGNGDGTFTYGATYPGEASPDSIAVADLNGDHKLDLAISNGASSSLGVLSGNGDGTFQTVVYYPVEFPASVKAADVNGDHKLDLVVANTLLTSSELTVFLGNGDGTFQSGVSYPAGNTLYDVAVADFNGDGMKDLAAPDYRSNNVIMLLNTGKFSISPTAPMVFPNQVIGTVSAPQAITLTNTGTKALSISSVSASGRFEASNQCGTSVAAGASCDINVSFKPRAAGQTSGLITIVDSASTKPQIIEVSGVGTVISFSPQALNFPNQKVGTRSAPITVTLTNKGSTTITLQGVTVSGKNTRDFSENNNCGWFIGPGTSCIINVTFAPGKAGLRSAVLIAGDNGGGSPQTVPLTGTGD